MRSQNPADVSPIVQNLAKHALATLATGGAEDVAYTHEEASAFKAALVRDGYALTPVSQIPEYRWLHLAKQSFAGLRGHAIDACPICGEDRATQRDHACTRRGNPVYVGQPETNALRRRLIDELEARRFSPDEHLETHYNSVAGLVVGGMWELRKSPWGDVHAFLPSDLKADDEYVMRFKFLSAGDQHPARQYGEGAVHRGAGFNGKVTFRNHDADALFNEVVAFLDKFTTRGETPPRHLDRPWRELPKTSIKQGDIVGFAPHTDMWMRGARTGRVSRVHPDGTFSVLYGAETFGELPYKAHVRREDLDPQFVERKGNPVPKWHHDELVREHNPARTGLTRAPAPGTKVRLTGIFLRNTGQHAGREGASRWTVRATMLGDQVLTPGAPIPPNEGAVVVLNEPREMEGYTPEEVEKHKTAPWWGWRIVNAANLEVVGAKPKAADYP